MRQDAGTEVLRQSFGEVASDYDRFRPGPPDEAVQWLVPAGAVDVLEIGAGTGSLTRRLTERVAHVRAVEPDARMRAVLSARTPAAEVVAGRAEEIPAQDRSFDVVIGASSWHWVDEERALPEVARVLRPGGGFSLLWGGADRSVDWLRSLWAGGKELGHDRTGAGEARRARHAVHLGAASPFHEPERRVFGWTRAMTEDDLVGMVGTYSAVITMGVAARQEYLDSVRRFIASHPVPTKNGSIQVPMRCLCWRTSLR
ncbi:MAG: class I SAM-dependent methyltransferase [Acidimicrobiales bacterium]